MGYTARRAAVQTLVVIGLVALALALWKLRLVVGLIFAAMIIAAAIRPGVDWLQARLRIPRVAGVLLHYAMFVGVIALALSFAVPAALHQVDHALSPSGKAQIAQAAKHSTGIKHDILVSLQKRLKHLPRASHLTGPAAAAGKKAFVILIGILFTFAAAAYWVFERDRAVDVVTSLLPRPKRKLVRDTWTLIDLRLGAFVRGQVLLIVLVGVVLSLLFWAIGEPYWLLVGSFAGLVEVVPVIGPLSAGIIAVAVGLTSSLHVAILAATCVLAVRLLEDYVVMPKVLGGVVGLSPLLVLFAVTSVGILFSGWAVLFAVPIAAVVVTLFDVVLRDLDPAEQDPPAILFSPSESEPH
ncbi:MAG TPA: AI-2E family transporter [Gaiellaceae bacterium]|nr:AI-2E family transporter [Gaiellaceae bacterium]